MAVGTDGKVSPSMVALPEVVTERLCKADGCINASVVLEGLTPEDICEAVEGVRVSLTPTERCAARSKRSYNRLPGTIRTMINGKTPDTVSPIAPSTTTTSSPTSSTIRARAVACGHATA